MNKFRHADAVRKEQRARFLVARDKEIADVAALIDEASKNPRTCGIFYDGSLMPETVSVLISSGYKVKEQQGRPNDGPEYRISWEERS